MPLQFRGLRAFCIVARHLSFKDAADELCLTASAVSHQIRDLEQHLGVKLFERRTRSIVLTQDGKTFYDEVHPHLRAIEQATDRLRDNPARCPLVVRMPEFFASELFMPEVADFSQAHRHIDLRIETTGPGATHSDRADVNILLTSRQPDADHSQALFPIRYVPACSAGVYERYAQLGPAALGQATLLVHQGRPQAWHQWAQAAGLAPPAPRQIINMDSMFALVRATEQGAGIALIPMPMSHAWFETGALRRLFSQDLITDDFYYAVAAQDGDNAEATALLWEWIGERFTESEKSCQAA